MTSPDSETVSSRVRMFAMMLVIAIIVNIIFMGCMLWLQQQPSSVSFSSSPQDKNVKYLVNKLEVDDNHFINGQWLWNEWQHMSAHDKKAIFALVASVTQHDFQVRLALCYPRVLCADPLFFDQKIRRFAKDKMNWM
jgi:hypothetical protein